MLSDVLNYAVPAGVSLYGLVVLTKGKITSFNSREARGAVARLLGLLLASTLPLALTLGSLIDLTPGVPRPDIISDAQDAEIMREILNEYRQMDAWRANHAPKNFPTAKDPPLDELPPEERVRLLEKRAHVLKAFTAEYQRLAGRMEARIQKLHEERDRIREERALRQMNWKEEAGKDGPLYVGLGMLLTAWGLTWLAGRPLERDAERSCPEAAPRPPDGPRRG